MLDFELHKCGKYEIREVSVHRWVEAYRHHVGLAYGVSASANHIHNMLMEYVEAIMLWEATKHQTKPRFFLLLNNNNGFSNYMFPVVALTDYYDPNKRNRIMTHPLDLRCLATHNRYANGLKSLYHDTNDLYGVEDSAYFPVIYREDVKQYATFADYLRKGIKMQFLSHFIGAKADKVTWSAGNNHKDITKDGHRHQLVKLQADHMLDFAQRKGEEVNLAYLQPIINDWLSHERCVLARNHSHVSSPFDNSDMVCAMLLLERDGIMNADRIVKTIDPAYKPYSLILTAQLAAIREAFWPQDGSMPKEAINLGLNMVHDMEYKDVIPHRKVVMKTMKPFDGTLPSHEILKALL